MAIKLDTPEPKEVAHHAAVTQILLSVPHVRNSQGDMEISKHTIRLRSSIKTWDENGREFGSELMVLRLQDMPLAVKNGLKSLYQWVENRAQADGFIGAGASEPLEEGEPPPADPDV